MAYRTVLCLTGADHSDQDVRTAAGLCAEIGAHLSVLVIPAPTLLMWHRIGEGVLEWPVGRGRAIAILNKRLRQIDRFAQDAVRLENRSRDIKKLLESMSLAYDVDTDYYDPASLGEVVRQRAICADLTITGPGLLNDENLGPPVVNGCLFDTGKPMLVVPNGAKATLWPRRVLVGWDSRVEASRAVREALGLLCVAEEVRVALVDPKANYNGNGAEPGADIAGYLTRHGARVSVDLLPSAGKSAATVLAQHATDISADMIVMGAYGSRGLRERLFGGVTRWIFDKPTLPLFLAR
ncbi:MAG: universal stress protein [Mesorhizobium sp.]|nr:universal stress protein [Mesorhizobium sp. M2A.F.Ca.ET.046.03.2.1]AZO71609.1 universal stress protein [Mesorhizobium sp. M1D.F.Ca.ET.043.01.1.1]RVC82312.1 universal stress protein [Mesorhizobium sp. M2A.F.Ca.ET.046.02.1.1]RWB49813.1 MAG: universal stress protein [Mesorhizobium sp.]RWE22663.1 MAG: universal stress protein [Mesorhizobium sp.]